MSTYNKWLRRLAFVLALAPLAMAAIPGAARADDHGRGHRDHRDRGEHRGWDHDRGWNGDRGYYVPPPPVYYAPQPRPSPGISLFFPIR